MGELAKKKCVPCEGGMPPLSREVVERYLAEVPEWSLRPDGLVIERTFVCKDFGDAMGFANRVAKLAEEEGHHPDISVSWDKVKLSLSTHAIGGLSENDYILAAKIDSLPR